MLVFGPSRAIVRLTLFAFASTANPDFHWVEFAPRLGDRPPCDPVRLGWIPNGQLWLIDPPSSLRPNDGAGRRLSLHEVIAIDEPKESLNRLTEFLRLPDLSQRIIASVTPNGHPGVVAVTNAQHAVDAFGGDRVRPILSVHRDAGFSVMVGHDATPGPGRDFFDFVFRLQGEDEQMDDWKRHQLVCEKGISSGPLRDRQPVRLDAIPLLRDVMSRARPSRA